jgi:hypothetical protein
MIVTGAIPRIDRCSLEILKSLAAQVRLISTASIIGMSEKNGKGIFVCRILVVKSIQDDGNNDGNNDGDDNNRRRNDFQIYACKSESISCL